MKTKHLFLVTLLFSFMIPIQAQINMNKLGKQIKKSAEGQVEQKIKEKSARETRNALDRTEKKVDQAVQDVVSGNASGSSRKSSSVTGNSGTVSSDIPKGTATLYVSANRGSNRNDGSINAPFKDLQKAVNDAPEGALILVAEGNYLGNLDRGYIEIKKYISIVGGYSDDFSERDPIHYQTSIRPPADAGGTNANHGLLDIYVRGKRKGVVLIDGLILDKGMMNRYRINDPTNPKTGTPEGCETGILVPPGFDSGIPTMRGPTSVSGQLIHGDVEGEVTIRNCVLMNGCHFGIQMGNIGGHFDIYNNIFLANRMAACEVRSMNKNVSEVSVDFFNNTVLFTWRRDPMPEDKDMGYGFRYMTGVNANVFNNIFGCTDFAALDRTYIDADKNKEAERVTSAWDNLFFANIEADLALPSGGGKFMRIFSKQFEDVEQLVEYEGNREMNDSEIKKISTHIDAPYLKGFLSQEGSSASTYNPSSTENILRSALGMNQRGTSSYTVSMYANGYPAGKVTNLFGALSGYGAQIPE